MSEDKQEKSVLSDHVRTKKRLVPPLMNAMKGKLSLYSWAQQVAPEFLWIALIVERYGFKRAVILCHRLAEAAHQSTGGSKTVMFCKFSDYSILSEDERRSTIDSLEVDDLQDICSAVEPVSAIFDSHPLKFLGNGREVVPEVSEKLSTILNDLYDRHSRIAVLSMAVAHYVGMRLNLIVVSSHLIDKVIEDFDCIDEYPITERSERAAMSFRAAIPMIALMPESDASGFKESGAWVSVFWERMAGFGPCIYENTLDDDVALEDNDIEKFIVEFRNAARADLRSRLEKWPLDLNNVEIFEVVSSLFFRQTTLFIEIVSSPGVWNPNIAPIIMRAMADVFITFAWIMIDPGPRSKRYIEDGLGAVKLEIEHRKREMGKIEDKDDLAQIEKMIEMWESWLKSQRLSHLVEVNLGSWSGISTRKMAEEAGVIDFYNYVYQPFSAAVHSNWAHVSMFNALHCENPAHRLHRSPAVISFEPDTHWVYLAAKYLDKLFSVFDDKIDNKNLPHNTMKFFNGG